jgi:hypothetical protein
VNLDLSKVQEYELKLIRAGALLGSQEVVHCADASQKLANGAKCWASPSTRPPCRCQIQIKIGTVPENG